MSRVLDWSKTEAIFEETPNVVAAWAFGSAQAGQVRPGGDVDIGVLFDQPPTLAEQLELIARLERALDRAEIDLTPLNRTNAILRFEAVSGRSLFCRDLARRAEFVSLTAREYEMAMALWQDGLRMQTVSG